MEPSVLRRYRARQLHVTSRNCRLYGHRHLIEFVFASTGVNSYKTMQASLMSGK